MRPINRRVFALLSFAILVCLSGCPSRKLNKCGHWNISEGPDQDTLRLQFSTFKHSPNQRKPDESGEVLRLRLIRQKNELRFDLPCSGCRGIYEEGPLLLTFGSSISTGTLQFEEIVPEKPLSGKLGIRFIQPNPEMETNKPAVWLEWDFQAIWDPTIQSF